MAVLAVLAAGPIEPTGASAHAPFVACAGGPATLSHHGAIGVYDIAVSHMTCPAAFADIRAVPYTSRSRFRFRGFLCADAFTGADFAYLCHQGDVRAFRFHAAGE
jgi:hypothetical protein